MLSTRTHILSFVALFLCTQVQAVKAETQAYVHRGFTIDAALYSYSPDGALASYSRHGSGMGSAGSTLGLAMSINQTSSAAITILPRVKDGQFLVSVELKPQGEPQTYALDKEIFDFTDLKPLVVTLATTQQGRTYQLNLIPNVRITDNTPQDFDVNKFGLGNWLFPGSPILIDDALYAGRIACAGSPVAMLDISGVGNVEFSLYQFKGAKPWGTLSNGIVTLTHPDQYRAIQISNVSNGHLHPVVLPGGPYIVWVRWSDPGYTLEQHRESLIKMRERIEKGEYPNATTEYLDKQLAQPPSPWVVSSGVRGFRGDEAQR